MDASLNLILSFNVIAPLFFLMIIGYVLVHGTKLADTVQQGKCFSV